VFFVAALGTVWFEVAPNAHRTPARTTAIGLLLGGPLAGVAFVYAASAFGLGVGGLGITLGAALLVAGGLFGLRSRHGGALPVV
jgi:hypothetical protein